MKELTLCYKCRQLLSEHYDIQPCYGIVPGKKCENCKKSRPDMKVFTVGKKGQ